VNSHQCWELLNKIEQYPIISVGRHEEWSGGQAKILEREVLKRLISKK
jgi:hypothetical protein